MTAGLQLMKRVLTPLAKNVFFPFGLSAGMSAADAAIEKEFNGLGTTALIILNEEMEEMIKLLNRLKNQNYQYKELVTQLKMKQKNKKEDFFQCY